MQLDTLLPNATTGQSGLDADSRPSEPLFLTEGEAELLILLCTSSSVSAGMLERDLLGKLGHYLRSFQRPSQLAQDQW